MLDYNRHAESFKNYSLKTPTYLLHEGHASEDGRHRETKCLLVASLKGIVGFFRLDSDAAFERHRTRISKNNWPILY